MSPEPEWVWAVASCLIAAVLLVIGIIAIVK